MNIDKRKAAVFGAAAAVRFLLFTGFPSLPNLLTGRVEISTPVTSFKRRMSSILATSRSNMMQYRKAYSSIITMCRHTMEGSITRLRSYSRSSPYCPIPRTGQSLQIYSTLRSIC